MESLLFFVYYKGLLLMESLLFFGFVQFISAVLAFLCCGCLLSIRFVRFRHVFFNLIRIALVLPVFLSTVLTRVQLLFRKPAWHVSGQCQKCGRCCELLAMSLPVFAAGWSFMRQIVCWYYKENYGMVFEGSAESGWLLFRCTSLDANRNCTIYKRRPRICRQYPSPLDHNRPDIRSGCGFKVDPASLAQSPRKQKFKL
jgi:hypothetical protein